MSRISACRGLTALELMRRLRAQGHGFPVIIMTGHGDVPLAVEAMKLGAFDFLEKPFEDEALITTGIEIRVRQCGDGGRSRNAGERDRRRVESLTMRERQVLERLVAGQPNKVIGRDLAISPENRRDLSRQRHGQNESLERFRARSFHTVVPVLAEFDCFNDKDCEFRHQKHWAVQMSPRGRCYAHASFSSTVTSDDLSHP